MNICHCHPVTAGELAVFQRGMLSPHAIYVGLYIALTYAWSYLACLAIDLLLILIVDGISKNILSEIRSLNGVMAVILRYFSEFG